jgi:excisionase family DNA binding protein
MDRKAFTVAGLADRWQVSTDTIYAMIHTGRLRAFKFGGKLYRIRPEEVERFECEPSPRSP